MAFNPKLPGSNRSFDRNSYASSHGFDGDMEAGDATGYQGGAGQSRRNPYPPALPQASRYDGDNLPQPYHPEIVRQGDNRTGYAPYQDTPSNPADFYSRSSADRYDQQPQRRQLPLPRWAIILITVVAAIAIIAGIVACNVRNYANSLEESMHAGLDAETMAVLSDNQEQTQQITSNWTDTSPFYMLIMGVDSSESRSTGSESSLYGTDDSNYRSDSIILARIDPGNHKVTLVSIHRDTMLYIDGEERKLNAAFSLGGTSEVIQVVSDFAGVPISHFAKVDFDGLMGIIDTLGGIEVNVPYEIDDPDLEFGIHLNAGPQTLDGWQALLLCRSRHSFDDLGDGDRYRAAHQRLVLSALAKKILSSDPITMTKAIQSIAGYVTTDLTVDQIINLALAMKDMDTETDLYSTMNPTENQWIDGTSYEVSLDDQWHQMMATIDAGGKPEGDSGYISVTDDINSSGTGFAAADIMIYVRDCTSGGDRYQECLDALRQNTGYTIIEGGSDGTVSDVTTVFYRSARFHQSAATEVWQICSSVPDHLGSGDDSMFTIGAVQYDVVINVGDDV